MNDYIYIIHDNLTAETIAATGTLNQAIAAAIRYLSLKEYICKTFLYDEFDLLIEFIDSEDFNIEGTVSIQRVHYFREE